MLSNSAKTYIAVTVIICGFLAVYSLSNFLEQNRQPLPEAYLDEDLSLQGEKLKGWSLGFEGLIADWYWVRSLQYMGDRIAKSKEETINLEDLTSINPKLLYPLLDNATTLDPKFMAAYSYGAVVLPAIDKNQAIKITEKGIKDNPNEWRLYQYLGYIHWRMKNFEKAAEVYEKGSTIKNAPPFLKLMAARMKGEKSGSRETAREIYRQMLNESLDSNTKKTAELRLMQLDAFDDLDAIKQTLENYKTKNNGQCVGNLQEIYPELLKVKLPNNREFRIDEQNNLVDPSDAPYFFNKQNCTVIMDYQKTKIPIY